MKKIFLFLVASSFSGAIFSQVSDAQSAETINSGANGKDKQKLTEVLNNTNKNETKTDILEITGTGGLIISTMNYPDITTKSGTHAIKITIPILIGASKTGGYQLVFFPSNERIAYAVETVEGITSINLPMSTFETINQKIDQYMAAKRKVQLKVIKNPNGYREGILIF